MNATASLFGLLLTAGLVAQPPSFLQVGNVVHCFGGSNVALLDTGLQTLTPLQIVPGSSTVVAMTWDPNRPDDLVVAASDNFIYRSTVTAGGVTITQLTTQSLAGVDQLSWDQNGNLIVVGEASGSQIWRIDPVTGARTTLLSWPLTQVQCGAMNQNIGDFYVGTGQGIYRVTGVPTGSPSVSLVAPTASGVTSLAFDPLQPQFVLFTRSQDVYRLNVDTLLVEPVWTGIQGVDQVVTAHDGSFRAIRSRDVFGIDNPAQIPVGGVPPQLLGSNTNIGCCALVDAVVIGETFEPFRLDIDSQPGCGATFSIANTPVGTSTSWMFFSGTTQFPLGTGPLFGLMPDGVTLVFMNQFPTAQPGNFLHSLGPPPATTVIPPGILCFLSGQRWDVVVAAWGPALQFWGRTNVARVLWQ